MQLNFYYIFNLQKAEIYCDSWSSQQQKFTKFIVSTLVLKHLSTKVLTNNTLICKYSRGRILVQRDQTQKTILTILQNLKGYFPLPHRV